MLRKVYYENALRHLPSLKTSITRQMCAGALIQLPRPNYQLPTANKVPWELGVAELGVDRMRPQLLRMSADVPPAAGM